MARGFRSLALALNPGSRELDDDFEVLIGIFDDLNNYLEALKNVSEDIGDDRQNGRGTATESGEEVMVPASADFESVQKFIHHLRRVGISHVLQVTYDQSRVGDGDVNHVKKLISSLSTHFGHVNIANLNYDTLLLRSAMAMKDWPSDMGTRNENTEITMPVKCSSKVRQLRYKPEDYDSSYMDKQVRLLHLHGSMTFWEVTNETRKGQLEGDPNRFAKVPSPALESPEWWRNIRLATTDLEPAVVLANVQNKDRYVREAPFNAAYEQFKLHLGESSHWLIIGYSFRDEAVNALLRDVWRMRRSNGDIPEKILISDPNRELDWEAVASALKLSRDELPHSSVNFERRGARTLAETSEFKKFVS